MGVRNVTILVSLLLIATAVQAQTKNLLQNPNAETEGIHWRAYGDAVVENGGPGGLHFAVRNSGYFFQDAALPSDSAGKYALLIGRVSSERINKNGAITGLPYLYGYMMADPKGGKINAYLQGQQMLGRLKDINAWAVAWGVFEIPESTTTIRYFLNQAERLGVPQNGSAARFDDLGLYLFDTADEARVFVDSYVKGDQGRESHSKLASSSLPPGTGKIVEWPPVDSSLGNVIAGENGRYIPTDIKALEIVSISAGGNRISPGEPFTARDDWLKTFVVRVKNTSDRPIQAIRLHFGLPEAKHGDAISGFSLEYGKGLSTGIDYGEQKAIAPGEEVELVRNEKHYKRDSEGIAQRTGVSNFTRVLLGHATVKFGDGTVWTSWKLPIAGSK